MAFSLRTHGVLLRRLVDHLDGAVEQAYVDAGLDYRPRFTPILRALLNHGPATLRALSGHTGVTHSAVSQTITQMAARQWVSLEPGADARERIVTLTPFAMEHLPLLERCWAATEAASRSLDEDIGQSLADILIRALEALERRPLADRLAAALSPKSGVH
ncbi:MarR family winged helix-turn-helix transcriptional regulator [Brevundimonas sp.]|uniref:MarR family winged helix-turn-helix transcriptional regulator n=1 Tax=Brevundimonas sp. TaxID=1871086 RepID=UPI002CA7EA19|nr:MarR family transcriptional regulator [Brevundimonas sp.]HWQ86285.1 MarR family transcriptional regulator [Brevundimonas sp.]